MARAICCCEHVNNNILAGAPDKSFRNWVITDSHAFVERIMETVSLTEAKAEKNILRWICEIHEPEAIFTERNSIQSTVLFGWWSSATACRDLPWQCVCQRFFAEQNLCHIMIPSRKSFNLFFFSLFDSDMVKDPYVPTSKMHTHTHDYNNDEIAGQTDTWA